MDRTEKQACAACLLAMMTACGGSDNGAGAATELGAGGAGDREAAVSGSPGRGGAAGGAGAETPPGLDAAAGAGEGGGAGSCTRDQVTDYLAELQARLSPEARHCVYAEISLYKIRATDQTSVASVRDEYSGYMYPSGGFVLTRCPAPTEPGDPEPVVIGPRPPFQTYQSELDEAASSAPTPQCTAADVGAVPTAHPLRLHGAAEGELSTLGAIAQDCGYGGLRIVVDSEGRPTATQETELFPVPLDPEIVACVSAAWEGLSFPCLASTEICTGAYTID